MRQRSGRVDSATQRVPVAVQTAAPLHLVLRWTGSSWVLRRHLESASGERVGTLAVALDLGNWMLLRFVDEQLPVPTTWLPVQRGGPDADWHALRCAVHAPRPLPHTP